VRVHEALRSTPAAALDPIRAAPNRRKLLRVIDGGRSD
jgi:hypothetical protein